MRFNKPIFDENRITEAEYNVHSFAVRLFNLFAFNEPNSVTSFQFSRIIC